MRKYVTDTKTNGATPIVCSLVPRKIWKNEKIVRSNDYGKWAAEIAKAEGAAFVDLNEIIARRYEQLGAEKVETLFGDEHTHTNPAGAEINAESVIAGLKGLKPCALCDFFSAKGVKVVFAAP